MSTSINDLPKSGDPSNDEDINENMMVNSILKEIENDEEINNENEDSLNYAMDSSQLPPKIDNQIPTPEMIQKAQEDIFNQNMISESSDDILKKNLDVNSISDNFNEPNQSDLNDNDNKKVKTNELVNDVDNILGNIIDNVKGPLIIFILFMLLSIPQLNSLILKILPKLSTNGSINMLGNVLKGLILSILYFIISFFL